MTNMTTYLDIIIDIQLIHHLFLLPEPSLLVPLLLIVSAYFLMCFFFLWLSVLTSLTNLPLADSNSSLVRMLYCEFSKEAKSLGLDLIGIGLRI